MAFFMKDEFPEVDMDKVIKMCIIHDLGEAFTGDIPTFEKTTINEATEEDLLYSWVNSLPENYAKEMLNLYYEMAKRETVENAPQNGKSRCAEYCGTDEEGQESPQRD